MGLLKKSNGRHKMVRYFVKKQDFSTKSSLNVNSSVFQGCCGPCEDITSEHVINFKKKKKILTIINNIHFSIIPTL